MCRLIQMLIFEWSTSPSKMKWMQTPSMFFDGCASFLNIHATGLNDGSCSRLKFVGCWFSGTCWCRHRCSNDSTKPYKFILVGRNSSSLVEVHPRWSKFILVVRMFSSDPLLTIGSIVDSFGCRLLALNWAHVPHRRERCPLAGLSGAPILRNSAWCRPRALFEWSPSPFNFNTMQFLVVLIEHQFVEDDNLYWKSISQ